MAKVKQIEDVQAPEVGAEELVNTNEEVTAEQETAKETVQVPEKPAAKATAKTATVSATKGIKIHTTEVVDCLISQVPYKIAKDATVEVPTDVAAILCNARRAYRV